MLRLRNCTMNELFLQWHTFFEQLADAYTPVLLVVALIYCFRTWKNLAPWLQLFSSILVVYGWMFIDNKYHLWPKVGLDYSTHTAAALALTIFISVRQRNILVVLGLWSVLLGCGQLMVLLGYHSWQDILSTALVVGCFTGSIYILYSRLSMACVSTNLRCNQLNQ